MDIDMDQDMGLNLELDWDLEAGVKMDRLSHLESSC